MTTQRIEVVIDGSVAPLQRSLNQGKQALGSFGSDVAVPIKALRSQLQSVGEALAAPLRAVREQLGNIGNLVAAAGLVQFTKMADSAALIQARLKDVTGSAGQAAQAQTVLFQTAQRLQVGYGELAGSFSRMLPAVQSLGGGTRDAVRLAEILTITARLSGASSAEAASSAQQFAQALASGVLQGDELKSILENNGTLSRALAEGLGVGVGQLKDLGKQGKLTSKEVFKALIEQYDKLQARSSELPGTVGGAWTQVSNAFQGFVTKMNEGTGVFAYVSSVMSGIADAIGAVTRAMFGTRKESENLGRDRSIQKWGDAAGRVFAFVIDAGRAVWETFSGIVEAMSAAVAAAVAAVNGEFRQAAIILGEAWGDAGNRIQRVSDLLTGGIGSAQREYIMRDRVTLADDERPSPKPPESPEGKGTGGAGQPSKLALFEAELAKERELLALAGEHRAINQRQELEYWRTVLRTADLSSKDRLAIERKAAALEVEVRREAAQQKEQIEADNARTAERLALAKVEGQRLAARVLVETDQITKAQALELEIGYEAQRYQIQAAALRERLTLLASDPTHNPVEAARIKNELLLLEQEYQNKRLDLLGAQAKADGKGGAGVKGLAGIFGGVGEDVAQGLQNVLTGTRAWYQEMANIFSNLRNAFINALVTEPLKASLAGWARMLAAKLGFLSSEQGAQAAASAATVGLKAAETTAVVSANAAQAGTGAAASQAPIPIIGPGLALAAMAAIFAAVSAMGSKVKSARNGFDIPKGLNPMTQLHEEEMVLPANLANPLRDLLGAGASGQGAAVAGNSITYNDHSGRLTRQQIRENAQVMAEELNRLTRQGWRPT